MICLQLVQDAFQILEYVMYPLGIVVPKYQICTWYWGGGLNMYACTSTYVISVTCTFPCNTNKIGSLRKVMFLTFMMCYEINICKKCVHKCLTQTQIEQKINRNTHHGIVGVNFNFVTPDCFLKPLQVHALILTLDWLPLIADSKICRVILLVLSMSKFTDWSRNGLHGILLDVQHLHSLAYSLARKRILSSYKVSSTQLNNKNVFHNIWRFNHES